MDNDSISYSDYYFNQDGAFFSWVFPTLNVLSREEIAEMDAEMARLEEAQAAATPEQ